MSRRAFNLIEVILAIAILGVIATFSVPIYRTYQVRTDLNLATEQTVQGLARAKLLSQSGQDDSAWGFYVPSGTLFRGVSYETRDQSFDEVYPMPSTITLSGSIFEVSYSRLEGKPNQTGSIVLTAIDGEERTVTVTVAVKTEAVAAVPGDTITICHAPGTPDQLTMTIVDSAWPTHQAHGDTIGPCPAASSSSESSAQSSSDASSSAGVSSSSSSSEGGGSGTSSSSSTFVICHKPNTYAQQTMEISPSGWSGHQKHGDTLGACSSSAPSWGTTCSDLFTLNDQGVLTTTATVDMKVTFLANETTYGVGGPTVPVYLNYSLTGGQTWKSLFSGKQGTPGLKQTISNIASGKSVALQVHWYYKVMNWLRYENAVATNQGADNVIILRRGDALPGYIAAPLQLDLQTILANYLDADKHLDISPAAIVVLSDTGPIAYPPPQSEDFQDAVFLVEFTQHVGTTCP